MEINLNQTAKIRLTEFGEEILKNKHYEFQKLMKRNNPDYEIKPFKLMLDEEGYYKNQLWCIIRDFGNYINIAMEQPFLTTIIIESKGW